MVITCGERHQDMCVFLEGVNEISFMLLQDLIRHEESGTLCLPFAVLESEPNTSQVLSKYYMTELHFQFESEFLETSFAM